jgi:CubicO group peptidase (beta-lactamase class C family)
MHPAARVLAQHITDRTTPGLQYLHFSPDSILFRYHAGLASVARGSAVSRHTRFNGFSVTKTITAVAVLQLVESGALELDQPARAYLPSFPYSGQITVRQLLTHSAGIPNPIPLRWMHLEAEHPNFDRDAFFSAEYARHPKVASAPNARFAYSNLGYQILGEIIEAVTGMPYERYVAENILARIGIPEHELSFALEPSVHARGYHKRWSLSSPLLGFLMDRSRAFEGREGAWQAFRPYYMNGAAYGGLIGTADGFARYVQALMDTSQVLLSPSSMASLFTENILDDGSASGMSLSWFLGRVEGRAYFDHAGGGGGYYAELRIYPQLRRGSVLLCNRTGFRNERLLDAIDVHVLPPVQAASDGLARRTP